MKSQRTLAGVVLLVSCLMAVAASGQTRPWVLVEPWQPGEQRAETLDDLVFVAEGQTEQGQLDTSLFYWDSSGRIRVDRTNATPAFVIGYKILSVSVDSELGPIHGGFWDVALLAGGRLGQWGDGYRLDLTGGAGTANDDHWGNSEAVYGLGSVGVSRRLDDRTEWFAGLDYNGSRVFWPDAPLPYVAWRHRLDERSWVALGLPMGGLHWEPVRNVALAARWDLLADAEARASYVINRHLQLFVQYTHSLDGFAIDGADNRRVFLQMERVGAGLRWITKWFDASFSGGYVLDQRYERGFDLRQTTGLGEISQEPFLGLRITSQM